MHCLPFPPRLSFYPLPNLKKKKNSSQHLTQSLASCLLIHTIRVRIRATASSPPPFGSPTRADRRERAENSISNLLKIKMNISRTASREQQLIDDVRASRQRQTGGGRGIMTTRLQPPLPPSNKELASPLCCLCLRTAPRGRKVPGPPPLSYRLQQQETRRPRQGLHCGSRRLRKGSWKEHLGSKFSVTALAPMPRVAQYPLASVVLLQRRVCKTWQQD
nr:uncharacterized protein LOC116156773 [Camelus dromedarius]